MTRTRVGCTPAHKRPLRIGPYRPDENAKPVRLDAISNLTDRQANGSHLSRAHKRPVDMRTHKPSPARCNPSHRIRAVDNFRTRYASTFAASNSSGEKQLGSCLRDESLRPSRCRPAVRHDAPGPRLRRAASVAQGAHMARKGADRTRELVRY